MKIGFLRERKPGELRVAVTPEAAKKYIGMGAQVTVESGAGLGSQISDESYTSAGVTIEKDPAKIISESDILIKVNGPLKKGMSDLDEVHYLKEKSILIGLLNPYENMEHFKKLASQKVTSFSLEFVPRISRAQTMDVLSSQSNLAGYRAVIDAVYEFGKAIPMMMTAAGTVSPARILILGAGVAGLQAIATAKRLGAVVSAFDVRPAVKEQVESLGATFIEVPVDNKESGEGKGGYAKEMSEEYKKLQQELIHSTIKKNDIVITTALIPGRPAPVLVTEEMVKDMKPGSVIVDLAVGSGGNCPLSKPDKIITKYGVKIVGYENMPSRLAVDASMLYARNALSFVGLIIKDKKISINIEDEIIKGSMITHDGNITNNTLREKLA